MANVTFHRKTSNGSPSTADGALSFSDKGIYLGDGTVATLISPNVKYTSTEQSYGDGHFLGTLTIAGDSHSLRMPPLTTSIIQGVHGYFNDDGQPMAVVFRDSRTGTTASTAFSSVSFLHCHYLFDRTGVVQDIYGTACPVTNSEGFVTLAFPMIRVKWTSDTTCTPQTGITWYKYDGNALSVSATSSSYLAPLVTTVSNDADWNN